MAPKRKRNDVYHASTSRNDTISLTLDAVQKMVYGAGTTVSNHQEFIVKLTGIQPLCDSEKYIQATVCDAQHSIPALVINKQLKSRFFFRTDGSLAYTVAIKGYCTSLANTANTTSLFLCITSSTILRVETATSNHLARPSRTTSRIQGGTAATFLQDWAPLFSEQALGGIHSPQNDASLATTTDFLAHCLAMKTLHYSSNHSTDNTQHYMSAIREFEIEQLDRQKASLVTNSEKVPQHLVGTVTSQHKTALEAAMAHAETRQELTPTTLRQWHSILCDGGLVTHAGVFRTNQVHAGPTCFTPPEHVPQEMEKLCNAIHVLESRLDTTNSSPVTLAAAVMMGLLDVHPFCDGNGRLARIACNWALRRAGLPFCINLFATPAQRREYICAIQTTRCNMRIVARGNVSEETLVDCMSKSGLLSPLVHLILEQVSRAVLECNKLVESKSALASDESQAKAARAFREKAAAGTCLICLDERPNVATLCCGKAVHLNCIAQWLSSRNSCPTCRTELPSLPQRETTSEANNNAIDDTTTSASTTELDDEEDEATSDYYETTSSVEQDANPIDDTTDYTEEATNVGYGNPRPNSPIDDTTEDTTDDTTEVVSPPPPRQARNYCTFGNCRNNRAADCSSGGCGRCCVLYGTVRCDRHNC